MASFKYTLKRHNKLTFINIVKQTWLRNFWNSLEKIGKIEMGL